MDDGGAAGVCATFADSCLPSDSRPNSVRSMSLCDQIAAEFARRSERNPRYSLRAMARDLGTHHSTLSRILERQHRVSLRTALALGARLGIDAAEIAAARMTENADAVLHLARRRGFRADSRWIASRTCMPLDDVNVAISELVHTRRVTMTSRTRWTTEQPA